MPKFTIAAFLYQIPLYIARWQRWLPTEQHRYRDTQTLHAFPIIKACSPMDLHTSSRQGRKGYVISNHMSSGNWLEHRNDQYLLLDDRQAC